MQKILALLLLVLTSPFAFIVGLLILLESGFPILFRQKRLGKDKKVFTIYKFRTMVKNAEKQKNALINLNEAHPPAFKIKNDPRFTRIGKILSRYGLDELPQLVNILKGEMAFVGPRPLPLDEAKKIPKKYDARYSVLPGITSPWVIQGHHKLTFKEWMESDIQYVNTRNSLHDIKILTLTIYKLLL